MLLRLFRYARAYRRRFLAASVCSILNKVFDLAPPLLIGMAVDVVVEQKNSFLAGFGIPEPRAQILVLGVLTVILWGLESVFQYAYAVLWRNLAQTIQHDMRVDTYAHVQRLSMRWFEGRSSGGILAILNDDVNQLERFLDGGTNDILQVGTTVVVISGIFFVLAPQLAWVAMLPIPFIIWGSFLFTKRIAPRYLAVRERVGDLSSLLAVNLGGMPTIRSFSGEDREVERVRAASEAYLESNRRAIRLSAAFTPIIRMVIVCGFFGTLVIGGNLALAGTLGVGVYSVLMFLTQRLLWPLTRLGETFDLFQRAMASTKRILDLLDTRPGIRPGRKSLPTVRGAVRFEEVSFAYDEGFPVLDRLDLDVAAGSTTAIVGATGAGKTTVVKLLLRFHDVTGGRILLDEEDLRDLDFESLRGAVGLVSQDVFLFHGTVRENIAYGRPTASEAEIAQAARIAEAEEFIESLPSGYDTIVGERGQKLSGGQRQRVSIARAVLKDPPILVLDEATSSVDNETEASIQRSLRKIEEGRTTIIIAHRLSTVRHATVIHVLERGRIVESGSHETLLRERGLYASLWSVQTGNVALAGD